MARWQRCFRRRSEVSGRFLLRCRAIVGDIVLWSPDELCWAHVILPRCTQTIHQILLSLTPSRSPPLYPFSHHQMWQLFSHADAFGLFISLFALHRFLRAASCVTKVKWGQEVPIFRHMLRISDRGDTGAQNCNFAPPNNPNWKVSNPNFVFGRKSWWSWYADVQRCPVMSSDVPWRGRASLRGCVIKSRIITQSRFIASATAAQQRLFSAGGFRCDADANRDLWKCMRLIIDSSAVDDGPRAGDDVPRTDSDRTAGHPHSPLYHCCHLGERQRERERSVMYSTVQQTSTQRGHTVTEPRSRCRCSLLARPLRSVRRLEHCFQTHYKLAENSENLIVRLATQLSLIDIVNSSTSMSELDRLEHYFQSERSSRTSL